MKKVDEPLELPKEKIDPYQEIWDNIFDGSVWILEQGTDFTCKPRTLRSRIYEVAKEKDLKVKVVVDERDSSLRVQSGVNGD